MQILVNLLNQDTAKLVAKLGSLCSSKINLLYPGKEIFAFSAILVFSDKISLNLPL
jgi:hypothetical protein